MRRILWTLLVGASVCGPAASPAWAVTGSLAITAVTPSGQPLPGATISLFPEGAVSPVTATTDSTGSASLTLETGVYRYEMRSDDDRVTYGTIMIDEGANRLDLTLSPSPSSAPGAPPATSVGSDDYTPESGRHRGFELSFEGRFGSWAGEGPVSGPGFTKPADGPESRIVATPDSFSMTQLEGRVRLGNWFASYEKDFADTQTSAMVGPGPNGDLFLGVNERGNNGRIFTGFATEEEIRRSLDMNRYQVGADLPVNLGLALFGYYEERVLGFRSNWNVLNFPDTRSETDHRLEWKSFGIGFEAKIPFARAGDKLSLSLKPEAWIGRGDYDYEADQVVLNPPAPEQRFSVSPSNTVRTDWGARAEVSLDYRATAKLVAELFLGAGIRTMPTVEQATGDQLATGQQDEIGFISPREYFLGVRLRLF